MPIRVAGATKRIAVKKTGKGLWGYLWPWVLTLSYSDDEDETAALQRELEKIKKERAEKREKEVGLAHSPHGLV